MPPSRNGCKNSNPSVPRCNCFDSFTTDRNYLEVFSSIGEAPSLVKKRGRDSCSLQRVKEKGNKGRQELHFADEHLCRYSHHIPPPLPPSQDLQEKKRNTPRLLWKEKKARVHPCDSGLSETAPFTWISPSRGEETAQERPRPARRDCRRNGIAKDKRR